MNKKQRLTKKQKTFLEIFDKTACLITTSCNKAKINRGTYYLWLEKNPLFKLEIERIKEKFLDFGEAKLIELLRDKDSRVVLHFAKTKLKERGYGEKLESEVTHKGEGIKFIIERKNEGNNSSTKPETR